jgi:acetylornithine deacetylase
MSLNPLAFTRELIDIESITGNESHVGDFLFERLFLLGYDVRRILVEPGRFDVLATPPNRPSPAVVFATHMDTVPPYIPSSEGEGRIYGRGSCDAKGVIAAQVAAAEKLRADGAAAGLLYLVGEEQDNIGARVANEHSIGCKFLINGEPTDNRLGVATKGALRVDIVTQGRMADSACPELGESAIEKLLEALARLREMKLPVDLEFGPSTMNIGVLEGGRAPNVIPDHAKAQLLYRLIGPSSQIREQIVESVGDLAQPDALGRPLCARNSQKGLEGAFHAINLEELVDIVLAPSDGVVPSFVPTPELARRCWSGPSSGIRAWPEVVVRAGRPSQKF